MPGLSGRLSSVYTQNALRDALKYNLRHLLATGEGDRFRGGLEPTTMGPDGTDHPEYE
jgi:hypothetical protein